MLQVLTVHYAGGAEGGDVLVTFSGPVDVAAWTAGWLRLLDVDFWVTAETVVQSSPTSLTFNSPDFPTALGTTWQLTGHPAPLAAPYDGVTS